MSYKIEEENKASTNFLKFWTILIHQTSCHVNLSTSPTLIFKKETIQNDVAYEFTTLPNLAIVY